MTETKESPVHHILFPNAVTASKCEADSVVKYSSVLNGKGQIWNNQSLLRKCVKPRCTRLIRDLRPLLRTPAAHGVCPCPSLPWLSAISKMLKKKKASVDDITVPAVLTVMDLEILIWGIFLLAVTLLE